MVRTVLQRMGFIGEVPYYLYKGTPVVAFDEIPADEWLAFTDYMKGSTMPSFPEIGTVFYAGDYERFKRGVPNDD